MNPIYIASELENIKLEKETMDFDILDSFDDLGVCSLLKDENEFEEIIKIGPKSVKFTEIVEWFSKELQALCSLDSCINSISDQADSSSFLLEVSSFLKELQCPYQCLLDGSISQRLSNEKSRIILLDYLCTELQAARLLTHKTKKKNFLEIEMDESSTATALSIALKTLNISLEQLDKPEEILSQIVNKVQVQLSSYSDVLYPSALTDNLTQEQWDSLHNLYVDFLGEYTLRRELLLTRLDATLPSFQWSVENRDQGRKILQAFTPKREKLRKKPYVKFCDVIAARENIFFIEKTSSKEQVKNTKSMLNRILIPAVPDRGGRPKEQRPPVEMPNWGKRSQGGGEGNHRGGGYRGGGHRGGGRGYHSKKHKGRQ